MAPTKGDTEATAIPIISVVTASKEETSNTDKPALPHDESTGNENYGDVQEEISCWQRFHGLLPSSISPKDPRVKWFSRLGVSVHIYNLLITPATVAWTCELNTIANYVLGTLGDLVLVAWVCLQCLVEIEDEFGLVEKDTRVIARQYLWKNRGVYDLLCVVPVPAVVWIVAAARGEPCHLLGKPDLWRVWAILRIFRFVPMRHLLRRFLDMVIPGIPVPISRLIKNLIAVMVFSHVSACAFWFLSSVTGQPHAWIHHHGLVWEGYTGNAPFPIQSSVSSRAAPGGGNCGGAYAAAGVYEASMPDRYLTSLYYAQKALFFSVRQVEIDAEIVYTVVETLIAAVVYGSLFGNLASIIRFLDSSAAEHKAAAAHKFRTRTIRAYMHDKTFPPELQERILAHNDLGFIRNLGMDEENVFADLPKTLKQDVADHLYLKLVSSLPLFHGCDPAFIASITRAVKPLTLLTGWYVFRQGDEAQEMYFIRDGNVDVCSADGSKVFVTLKPGNFFGEIALLENCKRTASVRAATTPTDLCYLSRRDFEAILSSYPGVAAQIRAAVAERKENDRQRAEVEAKAKALAAEAEAQKEREKVLSKMRRNRMLKKGSSAVLASVEEGMATSKLSGETPSTSMFGKWKKSRQSSRVPSIEVISKVLQNSSLSMLSAPSFARINEQVDPDILRDDSGGRQSQFLNHSRSKSSFRHSVGGIKASVHLRKDEDDKDVVGNGMIFGAEISERSKHQ
ncbi:hypothetical protein HDU85_004072 [Gaertneriomyces sp. JEL0708]|nr:hypothetical protein HDU85_004072 [Gaertneriomyces sp. JEL0708]